jgi:Ca2+-transporting ATPase
MSIPIQLQPNKWQGLSRENAANNLKQFGFNELPRSERKTAFKIAWHIISEPMILLLIACGSIYFILGDTEEAMILIGCIGVIIGITFYQEAKTEKALEALRDLSSPRALVIREGETIRIAGREVVVDDLVVIDEGDRVPADGVLVENFNLEIDESILTGESLPARKTTGDIKDSMPGPGVSESSGAFSGTLVVRGHGLMLVRAVGKNTEIGKIGNKLLLMGNGGPPLFFRWPSD